MNCVLNPFEKFNSEWALVTAGSRDKFNSMTISWGSMGTLWFKRIITIYIRSERYTFDFLKDSDFFTLSFYDEKYKDKLIMFGRCSGRDVDKVSVSGFNPVFLDNGITYEEAKETVVLKKLYMQKFDKGLLSFDMDCYSDGCSEHYMIIGEVINIL